MKNLIRSGELKSFYVWVNPKDMFAYHNANLVGSFVSVTNQEDNLMFLPNAEFSGYISPFQGNLLRSYQAEYKLEITRKNGFEAYPSRLVATFLFEEESEALKYRETHGIHVGHRELMKATTAGEYLYSRHDLGWIDFLRSPLILDEEIIHEITRSYWEGRSVKDFRIELMEKFLSAVTQPVHEILYIGRIDFQK
ncbi:MAG: hypothetical protein ACJ75J_13505 [Cytophagaceae bacterium]